MIVDVTNMRQTQDSKDTDPKLNEWLLRNRLLCRAASTPYGGGYTSPLCHNTGHVTIHNAFAGEIFLLPYLKTEIT
jgi:hypothetical protein